MKIRPILCLLTFLLLSFAPILAQTTNTYLSGTLSGSAPSGTYPVGKFNVVWDDDRKQLQVFHQDRPEKSVFETVAGQPFILAADGEGTFEEVRGLFFISDKRQFTCAEQKIRGIENYGSAVSIFGDLGCDHNMWDLAFNLTFFDMDEHSLYFEINVGGANRVFLTYASPSDEHIMGFGTQFSFFDFKGKRLPIWVSEQGIGRGAQPITAGANATARAGGTWYTTYAPIPHYITSNMQSLMLNNHEYAIFDMTQSDSIQIEVWASIEAHRVVSGYIFHGDTPAELINAYTALTGRMRPLPDWILDGAVVGMQGGTDKVRQVWEQLQAYDVPIAAFWLQDWVGQRTTSFGKQLWWNWELDTERYPDWDGLVRDFADANIRMMVYISPFLADVSDKPNVRTNYYLQAKELGYLVKDMEGQVYNTQNTDFSAALVDLTNPEAWEWYKGVIIQEVINRGTTGWMADFGEALPYDALLWNGETGETMHNRYPELWAQFNRELIEAVGLGDDAVFFMRAGYRESPRYSTLFWLGDQLVDWDEHDGIKTAVTGLLTSGLSGYVFNHSDIGGYTTITNRLRNYHRSEELLLRWMELNAFTTVFRTHEGNLPDDNVQFYTNAATLSHFARFANVYRAWAFYRRALVAEATQTGLPVVRHLFIHYPHDEAVYDISYQQFLVGTELLVAPVLDPQTTSVSVYLPVGEWVHVWTGQTYGDTSTGMTITIDAPLGMPAVFYPLGSAVGAQFVQNLVELGVMD